MNVLQAYTWTIIEIKNRVRIHPWYIERERMIDQSRARHSGCTNTKQSHSIISKPTAWFASWSHERDSFFLLSHLLPVLFTGCAWCHKRPYPSLAFRRTVSAQVALSPHLALSCNQGIRRRSWCLSNRLRETAVGAKEGSEEKLQYYRGWWLILKEHGVWYEGSVSSLLGQHRPTRGVMATITCIATCYYWGGQDFGPELTHKMTQPSPAQANTALKGAK